jgi:hypothetical protein
MKSNSGLKTNRRMLTFRRDLIVLIIEARALDAYVRNSSL